jgi:hypothetical protein
MHKWPILVISSGARDLAFFSYMRRKDFSPLARNDNCDTVSQGEGLGKSANGAAKPKFLNEVTKSTKLRNSKYQFPNPSCPEPVVS